MLEFSQQQNRAQNFHSVSPARPDHVNSRHAPAWNPYLTQPSAWGNQALQQQLRARAIQAKLTVNDPGDKYEQEADRVAEEVMRIPASDIRRHPDRPFNSNPLCGDGKDKKFLQTKEMAGRTPVARLNLGSAIGLMESGGQPLSVPERMFFEPRFGFDFSNVRIHHGDQATEAAGSAIARAFTFGHHVVFGKGQYQPTMTWGHRLLAHELTHVIQQTGNGQASGSITPLHPRVQRAPIAGCTEEQTEQIKTAKDQANIELNAAIPLLESGPLSKKAQDAMWLTFRDYEELKALMVGGSLSEIHDLLPRMPIYCEQEPEYGSTCKEAGTLGYRKRGWGDNIHLCMGLWKSKPDSRVDTLIHELAHNVLPFGGDPGYFGDKCEKTGQTAALSIIERFHNADSYSCLVHLLAHETESDLSSRVTYYQREYRGETLERIVQNPPGSIDLDAAHWLPRFVIKFEDDDKGSSISKIPGAEYSWLIEANGVTYPIGPSDEQVGQFTSTPMAFITPIARQSLKTSGARSATIQCDIKIPGAEKDLFTLQSPLVLLALGSGQKYLTKIPFDTGSTAPHEASMDELMLRLVFYGILSSDRYHINFIGHASRVGDDGSNQTLSELRAMAVKDRLEILLESMSEDVSFMFDDDKIDVEGQGEEEAKKADKPDDDDSSSDRVVEVIFEVK